MAKRIDPRLEMLARSLIFLRKATDELPADDDIYFGQIEAAMDGIMAEIEAAGIHVENLLKKVGKS